MQRQQCNTSWWFAVFCGALGVLGCGSARPPGPLERGSLIAAAASGAGSLATVGDAASGSSYPERAALDAGLLGAPDAAALAGELPLVDPPPFPRIAACASAPGVFLTWDGRHRLALHAVVSELGSAAGGVEAACPAASAEQRIVLGDGNDRALWQAAQPLRMIADDGSEVTLAVQTASLNGLPELGQFAFDELPGDEVDLVIETMGSWAGTLELRHADGSLALWFGRAPRVDALDLPKELSLTSGAPEYRAGGDCAGHVAASPVAASPVAAGQVAAGSAQQTLAFRQLDVQLGDAQRTLESGAQEFVDRWVFTNAGASESVDSGACGDVALGLVQAALWPGCRDVLQLAPTPNDDPGSASSNSARAPSSGLVRCGAQIFAQALPDVCSTDQGENSPECLRASDCADGEVCLCAGAAGDQVVVPANVCVPAACTRRADCGGFECAWSASTTCSSAPAGLYCQKSGDACEQLSECSGACRRDSAAHWSCEPEPVCSD